MARFTVIDATVSHVHEMVERLREDERFNGVDYKPILWRSFRNSLVRKVGLLDDEVAVLGGCHGSALSGSGEVWLCTTKAVERFPLSFVKQAREELVRTLMIFPRIHGSVSSVYKNAHGFLSLMGFSFGPPITKPNGVLYRPFFMER